MAEHALDKRQQVDRLCEAIDVSDEVTETGHQHHIFFTPTTNRVKKPKVKSTI
jgi:hypothetical protein